jgi:uncharacterized membrane protein
MKRVIAVLLFVDVLAYGLYAGFLLSVAFIEATLRSAPAFTYVIVEQVKHANLNVLAMILLISSIVCSLVLLVLIPSRRSPAFSLILAGLFCAVIAAAISLTVNVPINTSQRAWNPQAPPADWQQIRDRWQSAHLFLRHSVCSVLRRAFWPS